MTRPENLSLEYIYKKLLRLERKFSEFERVCYKWKQEDTKDIDKLKSKMEENK